MKMPTVTIEEIQEENINQSEVVVTVPSIQKHTQLAKRRVKLVMEWTFKESYEVAIRWGIEVALKKGWI